MCVCDACVSDVDMQGDKQLPLGGRIAMVTSPSYMHTHSSTMVHPPQVLKRILGVWLESLIPRLKEPLVSMVTTYSALLMQNLLGLPWQPSSRTFDMFAQLEELFSEISAATDSVGVASLAEHEVAVRMMERDKDGVCVCVCVYARAREKRSDTIEFAQPYYYDTKFFACNFFPLT